ncbi:MAG: hypothetical protein KGL39_18910 [Patescibacteria group bacterium]|nr:hypothetical protein [Patescibacteria group bacterium]
MQQELDPIEDALDTFKAYIAQASLAYGSKRPAEGDELLTKAWESVSELKELARLGAAVNNLAEGAGILRCRNPKDEWTWNLVETQAPDEPNAPAIYTCGIARNALEAAQIHRKLT